MITALFAIDNNGGLGFNGGMPWPTIKEDMKWFKETTQDQVVVMGKKSWLSPDMPKPLPKRHNVVFTNNFIQQDNIDQISGDVCEGLKSLKELYSDKEIFVIGGANLLEQSKPVLDRILVTRIPGEYICDASINIQEFFRGFELVKTIDLGTCKVEHYETV